MSGAITIIIFINIIDDILNIVGYSTKRISTINVESYIEVLYRRRTIFGTEYFNIIILIVILLISRLIMRNSDTEVSTISTLTKAPETHNRQTLIAFLIRSNGLKTICNSFKIIEVPETSTAKHLKFEQELTRFHLIIGTKNQICISRIFSYNTHTLNFSQTSGKQYIRHVSCLTMESIIRSSILVAPLG